MNKSFTRTLAAAALAASLTIASTASFAASAPQSEDARLGFEQVDSIPMLTRPHSWNVVDDETVVVWATPFDPYLVKLRFKSNDLKFAQVIGLTQFGSRVYARFDAVTVRGFRYPIDSIYKMTREEARDLVRSRA